MPDLDLARVFIAFVVLLFSLTVHETAHAWTADRLGDPTARLLGRISLNPVVHADLIGTVLFPLLALIGNVPLIGWAKPVPVNLARLKNPRRDHMLIAAAGPASNLVLAILASVALNALAVVPVGNDGPEILPPLATLFARALTVNVLLAVFNMIPIPPLDGGNVIGGLLPAHIADKYDALVRPYGFILLYALMLSGAFDQIIVPPARFLISLLT